MDKREGFENRRPHNVVFCKRLPPEYSDRAKQLFSKYCMPIPESGCWVWMGALAPNGYGRMEILCGSPPPERYSVHRVSYELSKGLIPEGYFIDHLCRVPSCFNPDHLEAVTPRVNTLRGIGFTARHAKKTHCIRGHEFSPENLLANAIKYGGRACRICANIRAQDARKRKRLEEAQ